MKRKLLISCFSLLAVMGCQDNGVDEPQPQPSPALTQNVPGLDRDALALHVVDLLKEQSIRPDLISTLQENRISTSFSSVLTTIQEKGIVNKTTMALGKIVKQSEDALKGKELPDNIEIPELWMHIPEGNFDSKDVLVAYPPMEGNEKQWKQIKAYTLDKKVVYLDAQADPKVPVVVVETKGHEAFLLQVEYMNKILATRGLQKNVPIANPSAKTAAGLDVSIVRKISLSNDEEPWIKGAAEIYLISSGIRSVQNDPQIKIIPMEYLDDDGKVYYPNQSILFWDEYQYQAANILFYEQDSNYNYKELTSIIVKGVFDITGPLVGQPWFVALGSITAAIIQAMPDDWYTDTDDYVDALYTIEKTKSYYNYKGAAANVKVDIEPYLIPAN